MDMADDENNNVVSAILSYGVTHDTWMLSEKQKNIFYCGNKYGEYGSAINIHLIHNCVSAQLELSF